eukprot:scaffold86627_cov54-Attheya_sp.AAC.3
MFNNRTHGRRRCEHGTVMAFEMLTTKGRAFGAPLNIGKRGGVGQQTKAGSCAPPGMPNEMVVATNRITVLVGIQIYAHVY